MKVIGITGGAGSGKSEVLKILKNEFGAHVIMADEVARCLSMPGQICYKNIVRVFGDAVIGPSGEIDRAALADIVFNDSRKLEMLNAQTHPFVREAIIAQISAAEKEAKASCVVIEAALLIETGYKSIRDELWYVFADEKLRRRRLKETRDYSDEKISAVMASQQSDAQFKAHCDRVISNNTTLNDVRMQLRAIFHEMAEPIDKNRSSEAADKGI